MNIVEAKRKHEQAWMQLEGVVSVGIGQNKEGEAVIRIGLDKERPQTIQKIPASVEGFPVEIEVSGEIRAL